MWSNTLHGRAVARALLASVRLCAVGTWEISCTFCAYAQTQHRTCASTAPSSPPASSRRTMRMTSRTALWDSTSIRFHRCDSSTWDSIALSWLFHLFCWASTFLLQHEKSFNWNFHYFRIWLCQANELFLSLDQSSSLLASSLSSPPPSLLAFADAILNKHTLRVDNNLSSF